MAALLLVTMPHAQADDTPPLETCLEVRELNRDEAAEGVPVRVEGVVSMVTPHSDGNFFLQDDTAGIFVLLRHPDRPHVVFDGLSRPSYQMRVEVEGISGPGGYAPVIVAERVRMLGTGELPRPETVPIADLQNDSFESLRVNVEGVVQRTHVETTHIPISLSLEIADHSGLLKVKIWNWGGLDESELVDARVRINGVGGAVFNSRGERVASHLKAMGRTAVKILEPAISDPFSVAHRGWLRPAAIRGGAARSAPATDHRNRDTLPNWRVLLLGHRQTELSYMHLPE